MTVSLLLFNRDLRVHDHPALRAAASADRVVPLFVFDEAILRRRLRLRRTASPSCSTRCATSTSRCGVWAPVSSCAAATRSARRCGWRRSPTRPRSTPAPTTAAWPAAASAGWRLPARRSGSVSSLHPGTTIVPPGELTPAGGDHFRVFSPYYRAWSAVELEPTLRPPRRLSPPAGAERSAAAGASKADLGEPLARPRLGRRAGGPPADARLPARPRSPPTGRATTTSPATPPPASRPTCASAASRRCELLQRRASEARRRGLRQAALLARLPPSGPGGLSLLPAPQLPRPGRSWSRSERSLEAWREGHDRLPDRRRRHAAARSARASCTTAPA